MATVIRPITLEDADDYNAYRRRMADEPENNIALTAGEYTRSVEAERRRIADVIGDPNQQILVALMDDVLCGQCMCRGSQRSALRHAVSLGIDVDQTVRGQGIGHALMTDMLAWARANPRLHRVELDVFATNRRAISLYLKHGFMVEGCRRHVYYKDGLYIDAYVMGLLL